MQADFHTLMQGEGMGADAMGPIMEGFMFALNQTGGPTEGPVIVPRGHQHAGGSAPHGLQTVATNAARWFPGRETRAISPRQQPAHSSKPKAVIYLYGFRASLYCFCRTFPQNFIVMFVTVSWSLATLPQCSFRKRAGPQGNHIEKRCRATWSGCSSSCHAHSR